jgi:hypothetical protein
MSWKSTVEESLLMFFAQALQCMDIKMPTKNKITQILNKFLFTAIHKSIFMSRLSWVSSEYV